MVVFEQNCCIQGKVKLFAQKWLYSVRAVVLGKKLLCSGKVIVFGISECIRAKWLYSGKVVVNVQSGCNRAKMVVFGQR